MNTFGHGQPKSKLDSQHNKFAELGYLVRETDNIKVISVF